MILIKHVYLADIQTSLNILCDSLYIKLGPEFVFIGRLYILHKYIKWNIIEAIHTWVYRGDKDVE